MANVAVYNLTGEKTKDLKLNDTVFAVPAKKEVVHQVYVALEANAREPWAHSKDRSDVRGGGRKPWKQKGTGRARHGSNRSPIWSGGGVTFGPLKTRNYKQKINKKMNRQAVMMCLSDKVKEEKLFGLESFDFGGKTKAIADLRKKLPGFGKSTLIVAENPSEELLVSTRNVENVHVTRAQDVNVVDLLHHQYIISNEESLKALEARLS
ncbi:50S ribosomal protein L4 [Candidatus Parcubacteria bacterium]|nr:MAG: 50S ribosomal protein L4 [Candidatus Parcubacteria bacterium]